MYNNIRRDLLNGVNATLLPHGIVNLSKDELINTLLYGYESLSFEVNAKILNVTLCYIQVSIRRSKIPYMLLSLDIVIVFN